MYIRRQTESGTWTGWSEFVTTSGGYSMLSGLKYYMSTVDTTKANNDVSVNTYMSAIQIQDKNTTNLGVIQLVANTDGSTSLEIALRNRKTDGTTLALKGIKFKMDKSGNFIYQIDAPQNFNAVLGTGYGTCSTAATTAAKEAVLENYSLVSGSFVAVKFTNSVPANATLNINGKGAKPIYYRGAAIENGIITRNTLATFVYNGTQYDLLSVDKELEVGLNHNVPRRNPKDITAYVTDGSLWDRLNGTNGYYLLEDLFVGDYIHMSGSITAPGSDVTGSEFVTIAGIDTLYGIGSSSVLTAHHLVMVPGKGFDENEKQHFGKAKMNTTATTVGAYKNSYLNTDIYGPVVNAVSANPTTINEQLFNEFGSHLKITNEMLSNATDGTRYNRYGSLTATSGFEWTNCQAISMSEIEVMGSIVWSSSGFDTGVANRQLPLFANGGVLRNNRAQNNFWFKDVANGVAFCCYTNSGLANVGTANADLVFVRPRFILA